MQHNFTLEKLTIYFRQFNGRYQYISQHINYSPLTRFSVTLSFSCVHIHIFFFKLDTTRYTLDYTVGTCSQQQKITFPGNIFLHFHNYFQRIRVVLGLPFIPNIPNHNIFSIFFYHKSVREPTVVYHLYYMYIL